MHQFLVAYIVTVFVYVPSIGGFETALCSVLRNIQIIDHAHCGNIGHGTTLVIGHGVSYLLHTTQIYK
jgi:hypothetical protein